MTSPIFEALVLQKFRRQIRDGAGGVRIAHDGIEALASIEQHPHVDLVVADINMPLDGRAAAAGQALQEAEDKKSTIIVSAYGDMSNIRTAMNRGAFDFLTKPIDFVDLETTIRKTIRHIEMLREARRRQMEAERAHASLSRYFSPQIAGASRPPIGDSDGMEVLAGGRSRPSSPTSPASPRSWRPWRRKCWANCSTNMSAA